MPRPRITFANVTSLLALVVALSGTSYAALRVGSRQIVNNSIRSADLHNNDVRGVDLRDRTVGARDVAPDTLGGGQINESSLATVPSAAGAATAASAANADRLDNLDSTAFVRWGSPPPSGTTIAVPFGGVQGPLLSWEEVESFPAALAAAPKLAFAPGSLGVAPAQIDTACSGSTANPSAPPGEVCIYETSTGAFTSTVDALALGADGRRGFFVRAIGPSGTQGVEGTWVYTAP